MPEVEVLVMPVMDFPSAPFLTSKFAILPSVKVLVYVSISPDVDVKEILSIDMKAPYFTQEPPSNLHIMPVLTFRYTEFSANPEIGSVGEFTAVPNLICAKSMASFAFAFIWYMAS